MYLVCGLLSTIAWSQFASSEVRSKPLEQIFFDIPAAPLKDALKQFAQQTQVQLLYPAEIVGQNDSSSGVKGLLLPIDALERLIKNNAVEAIWLSDKIVTLRANKTLPEAKSPPLHTVKHNASERIETLIVTGSRIAQPYSDQVFPTLSLNYQTNFRRLNTNLGDTLNKQAIFCSGTQSLSASGLDRNIGASFPDLYCLDSQRTLTLVDGKRWVPSNSSDLLSREPGVQFDINSIPSNMLERIEIIGVGSSAVYGSDAVAGTVNLLLRDKYEGFEINLEGGSSERNDGEQYRISLLGGGAVFEDKMQWLFAYEYYEQEEIRASDRAFTASNYTYLPNRLSATNDDGIADFIRYADVRSNFSGPYGIPTLRDTNPNYTNNSRTRNMIFEDGRPLIFDASGRLRPVSLGEPTAIRGLWIGGDGEQASDYRTLRNPTRQHKFFTKLNIDINSNISAYTQLHYFETQALTRADPIRSASSRLGSGTGFEIFNPRAIARASAAQSTMGRFSGPSDGSIISRSIPAPLDPQWFHPDDIARFPNNNIFIHRTWSELNDGISQAGDLVQIYAGLDGSFVWGDVQWNWDIDFGRGETQSENFRRNIDCRESFCSPQRSVRNQGPPIQVNGEITDPAIISQLSFIERYRNRQEMSTITANAKADLLELPAGPLQLSLGLERRSHKASGKPDTNPIEGIIEREPTIEDGYDTKESMFELRIPLLDSGSNIPGLDLLGLDTAYRWVSHSRAGDDSTYSIGGKARFYLGANDTDTTLTIRGNRTKSIRSPSLQEVAFPQRLNGRSPDFTDPCNQDQIAAAQDPEQRRSFCIEDAQRREIDQYNPDTYNDSRVNESIETYLEGNPNLVNEQGRSYTFGALLEKGDDVSLALDLVNIDISGAPIFPSEAAILAACYEAENLAACAQIDRRTGGPGPAVQPFNITEFRILRQNVGTISTRLTQYHGRWRFGLDRLSLPGKITLSSTGQFLHSYQRAERELAGLVTFPKRRVLANIEYAIGDVTVAIGAQHFGTSKLVLDKQIELLEDNQVDAYTLYDLALDYQLTESALLYAGAKNVFDEGPPEQLQSIDAVNEYAPIGRYYLVGARFTF